MAQALANPTVTVNNIPVSIVPNSASYTEGKGEQVVRAASTGGGRVTTIFSNNVETNISNPKFSVYNTPESIELARDWKSNGESNVITFTGNDEFTRTFNSAVLTNDVEVLLSADGQLDLEFMSEPSV